MNANWLRKGTNNEAKKNALLGAILAPNLPQENSSVTPKCRRISTTPLKRQNSAANKPQIPSLFSILFFHPPR
jgi:hypothetical protein